MMHKVRTNCRSCNGNLGVTMVDLGAMPPANAYLRSKDDFAKENNYPLKVVVCSECFLAQTSVDLPPSELFADYAYLSSYSSSWLQHAADYCSMAAARFQLNRDSFVVEIASNDGYLLKNFVNNGIRVLGVDPSDTVARAAEEIGVPTVVEFFGKETAEKLQQKHGEADLIIANNVFAHVPDINDFLSGFKTLLNEFGTITFEFPHLLKLIENIEFDTVYHEHFSYLSLVSVEKALGRQGLKVYDIEELPTHGGSLRIYCSRTENTILVETDALKALREKEARFRLTDMTTYCEFAKTVNRCRDGLIAFIESARDQGKTIVGYGAAAKGNTLLNYCGIDHSSILFVADRNPYKQDRYLPGSHIPVVAPDLIALTKPDYILILPWNLAKEITNDLSYVSEWGGKFVVPVPTTRTL